MAPTTTPGNFWPDITCYHCKRPGHSSSKCPAKSSEKKLELEEETTPVDNRVGLCLVNPRPERRLPSRPTR
ncbi:Hypothetical protein NTJ_05706 [Nesidiocoris tenuis]|uniref:CCHC-type domain-containing protein n=1 Tax=Nesidiocoris tenuis TaxID=355587 RepID=A0ABN7APS7_9HEMI|nr:Hypothetical protein NTJ_05706 [Nesidiocoris tenuis]